MKESDQDRMIYGDKESIDNHQYVLVPHPNNEEKRGQEEE